MAKLSDVYERDFFDLKVLLLEYNEKALANSLDGPDREIYRKLIAAVFALNERRKLRIPSPPVCLLRELRVELGMTQDELATEIDDLYQKHFREIETEKRLQHDAKELANRGELHQTLYQEGKIDLGYRRRPTPKRLTGRDINWAEMNRPHREKADSDFVAACEFYFNRSFEALMSPAPEAPEKKKKPTKPVTERPVETTPVDIPPVDAGQPVEPTAAVG
ncbi:MAG: hypothetical protein HY914_10190 [Desulfomonile tiedjei]|nr:hypothetical protein [Desulfomonile tiedjei]